MNIAIDLGKHSIKAFNGVKKFIIENKLNLTHISEDEAFEDSRIIEFENKKYVLGKQGESRNYDLSKATKENQIAMYAAIAEFSPSSIVNLFVGCPLTIYKNAKLRKEYVEFLEERKDINIKINGEDKRIQIGKIIPFPESYGLPVRNSDFFSNKTIGVIDIGGLNLNGCIYLEGSPQWNYIATENLGVNVFKEKLRTELNSLYGTSIQDIQMNDILENGVINKPDSKEFIELKISEYIKSILNAVKKKEWDISTLRIGLTGGGSKQFKSYFEKELEQEIISSKDGEFDNVIGFYTIGVNYVG